MPAIVEASITLLCRRGYYYSLTLALAKLASSPDPPEMGRKGESLSDNLSGFAPCSCGQHSLINTCRGISELWILLPGVIAQTIHLSLPSSGDEKVSGELP